MLKMEDTEKFKLLITLPALTLTIILSGCNKEETGYPLEFSQISYAKIAGYGEHY